MLTSKQRSNLRSIAQKIDPIGQIGKGGLSDNQIKSFSDALEARELIKLTMLDNADLDIKELAEELAKNIKAEVVCTIGRKIVLYRYSQKKNIEHIDF